VKQSDLVLLPGITGREYNLGIDPGSPAAVEVDQSVGGQPRSIVTGQHQPGMGDNETVDGLSETEEAIRAAAEGQAEAEDFEELPVFDRADAIPKII
jgi:hypothetical protein